MSFIDRDKTMKAFESVLGASSCELNGYEIWEVLNSQESIEAIPIEWMKEQRDKEERGTHVWWIYQAIINKWQEEQEKTDEID